MIFLLLVVENMRLSSLLQAWTFDAKMKCPKKQQQIPGGGAGWGLMGTWIDCAVTNKFQQHSTVEPS